MRLNGWKPLVKQPRIGLGMRPPPGTLHRSAEPVEPTEISSRDQLEAEHYDLRIALRWALTKQDSATALRCTSALFRFWELRGHFQVGCASVQQALASSDDGPAFYRGRALN